MLNNSFKEFIAKATDDELWKCIGKIKSELKKEGA